MNEIFNDKLYLTKYNLDSSLFKKFDVYPYDLYPLRSVFVVNTDKGMKILKKINYTEEELNFIWEATCYIRKKFKNIMSFTKTQDGKIYTKVDEGIYCMVNLVSGRECDYNNPIDIKLTAKGLSLLHKASKGFKTNIEYRNRNGKLINRFEKTIYELKTFKNIAFLHKNKNRFDELFLENVDCYLEKIRDSIEYLKKSDYDKLCKEEDTIVLCHNDLAYHNIIIDSDKQEAHFIDFDYAIMDLRVHDLCNFVSKVVKNFGFDIERAKLILDEYNTESELDEKELKVLYGMLMFPYDFYSICKDYYTKRKIWEEKVFEDRFKKKLEFEEFRMIFLKKFKQNII